MFSVSLHVDGKPVSSDTPAAPLPRNCVQSPAWATVARIRNMPSLAAVRRTACLHEPLLNGYLQLMAPPPSPSSPVSPAQPSAALLRRSHRKCAVGISTLAPTLP